MNGIRIATTLVKKRKEKNITQEELAHYMGVSKASVSKWETGASYPDIAFLPQLATYFDISIDELMDYQPQMTKEEIRALYHTFTDQVTERPFEDILEDCRETVRKYYACYPLLLQMGLFLFNNQSLISDQEKRIDLVQEAQALFERVQAETNDAALAQLALKLNASCCMALGDPDGALVLLESLINEVQMPPELIASAAYQMKGDVLAAKRIMQVGIFQGLVVYFNYVMNYLTMVADDTEAFSETVKRAQTVAELYDLRHLHPFFQLGLDLTCANAYALRGEQGRCLDALEKFTDEFVRNTTPLDLHGDAYFNLIDSWLAGLDNGTQLPRNTALVTEGLVDAVLQNPAFAGLTDKKRYRTLCVKLEKLKAD